MALAYDLLKDRRTIDVIITSFSLCCFKMAERFKNLENLLRDWAKENIPKILDDALNWYERQEEEKKFFFLEMASRSNQDQLGVQIYF